MKKIPERTCMGCNEAKPKKELLRIVRDKEGNVAIDLTGKMNGRGAYICNNVECLDKVIKSNRLARVLDCKIDDKIYEDLRDVIAKLPN